MPHIEEPSPATIDWLHSEGWAPDSLEPLAGDVSARRYFRLLTGTGHSAILATYPEEIRASCRRFAEIRRLLDERGVRVPEILASACDSGLMLVEDLGRQTLYDQRHRGWTYLGPRLEAAARSLDGVAKLPADRVAELNPPLGLDLLSTELSNTWRVVLGSTRLGESGLPAALESALETMLERLGEAPTRPCHRDYMARNLVPFDGGQGEVVEIGVLDFQDLRLGPRLYDLASLLNDSLYAPEALEASVLATQRISDDERFDYHRCAAQRTLKIVGTFVGFAQRGMPVYLPLVEPSLESVRRHLRLLPEIEPARTGVDELANVLLAAVEGG